jgi:hypothetical protein
MENLGVPSFDGESSTSPDTAASPQNYRDNERDSFHLNISYDASEESNNDMVANNLDLSFRSTAKPGDDDVVDADAGRDGDVVDYDDAGA